MALERDSVTPGPGVTAGGPPGRVVTVTAPAKVNLCLAVGERLPNGYHQLLSLATTVSLADRVVLEPADRLEVVCETPGVPSDEANLAYRAALLMGRAAGREPRVRLRLIKQIPVAAGLAGGSADAAAVLVGLDRLWGLGWPRAELARLGLQLGSDVPFCLQGGAALMAGVGEELTPLDGLPSLALVLAAPRGAQQSTARAYAELDRTRARATDLGAALARIDRAVAAWRQGDLAALSHHLFNDFEPVTRRAFPRLAQVAHALRRGGALGVVVSGSGPTVLGIVPDRRQADELARSAEEAGLWAVPAASTAGGPNALD